jgi:hypothetical protein
VFFLEPLEKCEGMLSSIISANQKDRPQLRESKPVFLFLFFFTEERLF